MLLPARFSRLRAIPTLGFALVTGALLCSCETTAVKTPAEGPNLNDSSASASAKRARSSGSGAMALSASPTQINPGASNAYTVAASRVNPGAATTVNYAMGGTATQGKHYTLSGASGKVVIPAGASSASVTLTALQTSLTSGSMTATMSLRAGSGYTVSSSSSKATVTIAYSAPSPTPAPTATPTPSPSPSATPSQEVWIGLRTDGLAGAGTQLDPYDASSAAKFDTLMQSFAPYAWIHLGAGTFLTNGSTGFGMKKGQQILGAGVEVTTVKLMSIYALNNGVDHVGEAIVSAYNVDGSETVVADLTVDCNASYFTTTLNTNAVKVGAVGLRGNNCTIRNVHAIHAHGDSASLSEVYTLYVDGYYDYGRAAWQSVTNATIADCLVDQSTLDYGCAITLINQGNINGSGTTTSGVLRNNTVKDWAGTSAYAVLGSNIELIGNTAIDCGLFMYGDSGASDHVTVHWNTAYCGAGSQPSASGRTGFAFFNKAMGASFNHFLIENNTVIVRPKTNNDGTLGLLLLGSDIKLASDFTVRNNNVSMDARSPATIYTAWELGGVDQVTIYGNTYDRTPYTYADSTVTNLAFIGN